MTPKLHRPQLEQGWLVWAANKIRNAYDVASRLLNNTIVFSECTQWREEGQLTVEE